MIVTEEQLERARSQATKIAKDANEWLASVSVEEFCKASKARECELLLHDLCASNQAKSDIWNEVVRSMCGREAENAFVAGMFGSIWFDMEVINRDDGGKKLSVRIALVPPSHHAMKFVCSVLPIEY